MSEFSKQPTGDVMKARVSDISSGMEEHPLADRLIEDLYNGTAYAILYGKQPELNVSEPSIYDDQGSK